MLAGHQGPGLLLEYVLHEQPSMLPGMHAMELVVCGAEVCVCFEWILLLMFIYSVKTS